jgi:hypothetical protein
LITTAAKEHHDRRKVRSKMNSIGRDILALLGGLAIVVVAFLLLQYGRTNGVSAILSLGFALDAIATTGIVGNLIVFGLTKLTRWSPVRIALWTFLTVHTVLLVMLLIVGNRLGPQFNALATFIGYVVSFLFWVGLHWAWRATVGNQVLDGQQ